MRQEPGALAGLLPLAGIGAKEAVHGDGDDWIGVEMAMTGSAWKWGLEDPRVPVDHRRIEPASGVAWRQRTASG